MPLYKIDEFQIEVSRLAALVDTNVLVNAFLPQEPKHDEALLFLEEWNGQLLMPITVIVEAWGMLVGSRKRHDCGCNLLAWVSSPGSPVYLLPQHSDRLDRIEEIARDMRIDCVDALLLYLADEFTEQGDFDPPFLIATYDLVEFFNSARAYHIRANLLDLNTLERIATV